jgi:hypothetical protein
MLGLRQRVVEAPEGVQWRIGRLWINRRLPKWRRVRLGETASDAASIAPLPDAGLLEDFAGGVAVLVGIVVVAVVLIPLLLFGIELILLGLLIALGILGRGLLGRPWVVRAAPVSGQGGALAWRVAGWRRSARVIDEVAASLSNGQPPVPAEASEAPATEAVAGARR